VLASLQTSLRPAARNPRTWVVAVTPLLLLPAAYVMADGAPGLALVGIITVVLAGCWFGILGGAVAGAWTGLALGPVLTAVTLTTPLLGHPERWPLRVLFFVLVGSTGGAATRDLRRGLELERSQRRELARLHARALTTFARLVALRDQPTAYHCERVAENARTLGRHYGLEGHELDALYWAGLLHDLGKITTPAAILLKEGALEPAEYRVIQEHTKVGSDILLAISPRFDRIAEGVRTHHERWDGGGYPHGLHAENIPLFGRILAVVDVFEAMTSPRPYREALPVAEVLRHLREGAGEAFDAEAVRAFVHLHRRGLILVHGDGRPTPQPVDTGIFTTGFWRAQGREPTPAATDEHVVVLPLT